MQRIKWRCGRSGVGYRRMGKDVFEGTGCPYAMRACRSLKQQGRLHGMSWEIREIPIDDIRTADYNPRVTLQPGEKLTGLTAGIYQPDQARD